MRRVIKVVQQNMYKVLPFVIFLTFITLMQRLFIQPDGFFPTILNYCNFVSKYNTINMVVNLFITLGYKLVVVFIITLSLMSELREKLSHDHLNILVAISILIAWNLVSIPMNINWLILPLYLGTIILPLRKVKFKWRFLLGIAINSGYAIYILVVQKFYHFNLTIFFQQNVNGLIGDGSKNSVYTILLESVSTVANLLGVNSLPALNGQDINLTTANNNLVATLQHHVTPYKFTMYPISSFLLVGGTGMLLALFIALILQGQLKQMSLKLYFVGILLIFDLWWPLAFMFPILWRLDVLKRAVIVTITNGIIGSLLLCLHLKPAIYWVPTGMPNLFFGGLASHQLGAYSIILITLLIIDVIIYWPLAHQLTTEIKHEKNN
ncbi:hypothetical protein [Weissella bombi]|uniref:Phosphotransferase system cellobiose-specific component IIC n=1 Tax=Weissella bombi TaxID=1505725 RepID=A0A1C3YSN2_9LACO|nr:hypothetical protein [Weissella bombi]SCB73101.1 Phosphotransferase system cellobiose-specific component IIC [Weissella bombi]